MSKPNPLAASATDQSAYDVAVIGGGINGAGIARDAAGRYGRVLLLERGDLAQGTSSASTKLIHGGLRYLEHYEFALVREALSERERLWAIAPHIIWPMRFVLPHVRGLRPRWLLRLGLFLYDHIGGRKALAASRGIDLSRHPAGADLKPSFKFGFEYSDGWVDDARLVVLNARDAARRGADILTRHQVTDLAADNGLWRIEAKRPTGEVRHFLARSVVNAAGPSVLDLLGMADARAKLGLRLVRGSHIVVQSLFDHPYSYFFQLADGRIFFAIPYERAFTLIGTTDQDHDGDLSSIRASAEEIAYLCEAANRYFQRQITPADVVWSYSGVRPLIEDGSSKPEAATRGYKLVFADLGNDAPPLLSVFGGKITTYRHLAEEAVAALMTRVPLPEGGDGRTWTGKSALPGGEFPMTGKPEVQRKLSSDYPFLTPSDVERLTSAYGLDAWAWLGDARAWADLGQAFGAGLTEAEVRFLIHHEWAETAEDVLWRRSKLGLFIDAAGAAALESYMQTSGGKN